MELLKTAIIFPMIFLIISRILNSKINIYLHATEYKYNYRLKFYNMKVGRFFFISVFCRDVMVAKRVIIYSVISLINTLFMIISALISYFFEIEYLFAIFELIALIILVFLLASANFRDRTVWTIWGTRKK